MAEGESLFQRSSAVGIKGDEPGDLGSADAGARVAVEGDQEIYRKRRGGIRADRERATDAEGQGRVAYPSRETVKWLKVWRGHSTRVGAAQDLAELDIDLAAITQAGGWKSPRMQYAEKINAARSGMARAAAATGRDLR
jgi:hypothetical protein